MRKTMARGTGRARMPRFLSTQFVITAQTENMIFATGLPSRQPRRLVKSGIVTARRSAQVWIPGGAVAWQPGRHQLLLDTSPEVQKEAAPLERLAVAGRQPDVYTAAFREISPVCFDKRRGSETCESPAPRSDRHRRLRE